MGGTQRRTHKRQHVSFLSVLLLKAVGFSNLSRPPCLLPACPGQRQGRPSSAAR